MGIYAQGTNSINYQPHTASYFAYDRRIEGEGYCADIRRYSWSETLSGIFEPLVYYLEFTIIPRRGHVEMKLRGQHEYREPGSVVFVPAGEVFETHCAPSQHHTLCISLSREHASRFVDHGIDLARLEPCLDVHNKRIQNCLARLVEEVGKPGLGADLVVETGITMLMLEIYRHLTATGPSSANLEGGQMAPWRLRRIKGRMTESLEAPPSIMELAEEFGLSPRHLVRTFKNTTGVTLSDYIAALRLGRAQELLAREDVLIKQVAGKCGYLSAAAFAAAFRNMTGRTPRQFRQDALASQRPGRL